jgi:Raf kinase inhibitor-like YbhB/YbcL family protein
MIMRKPNILFFGPLFLFACSIGLIGAKGGAMHLAVTSTAFGAIQNIPKSYTCDGADISPPLAWGTVPNNSKSIVVICDDPDASVGTWVHWVCYDIPPVVDSLPEAVPASDTLSCGGKQGKNDFGKPGYGGPCPPSGTHRYFFKVYALDMALNLPSGKTKREIEKAMKGHILASGELVGKYSR